jgi:hypothetical protein
MVIRTLTRPNLLSEVRLTCVQFTRFPYLEETLSNLWCVHRATPLLTPDGYQKPVPWQSGHAKASSPFIISF